MTAERRIGIVGSGDVAKALGRGLVAHGYHVMLGSRTPAKLEAWRNEVGAGASTGTPTEAAGYGAVVILATHGAATEAVVESVGAPAFAGKLVLDATNPLDLSHGMPPGLLVGVTDSLGERVQRKLPQAHVVKCFNTVGSGRMVDPKFTSGPVRMWICGNDPAAKREAEALVRELGWAGVLDIGGIDGARWLEALVPLWVRAGLVLNAWDHALQAVR